jgi:aspartyl-tRNA(Asn)/glutamyl-tRNA(Gln) amidotransferase subunit B
LNSQETTPDASRIEPRSIADIIRLIDEGSTSYGLAVQKIFPALTDNPQLDIRLFAEENGLRLESSPMELEQWIDTALQKHAQKITEYKKGKKGLISLFVGEVMKLSKGKVDAREVTEKIIEKLKHSG